MYPDFNLESQQMQLRIDKDIYDILLILPKSYTQRKSQTGCKFMNVVQ